MNFKRLDYAEAAGTCLQGYVVTTLRNLSEAFGEPEYYGDSHDKVIFEWVLEFSDGTIATIYDWKSEVEPNFDELMQYHIGGFNGDAVLRVTERMEKLAALLAKPETV